MNDEPWVSFLKRESDNEPSNHPVPRHHVMDRNVRRNMELDGQALPYAIRTLSWFLSFYCPCTLCIITIHHQVPVHGKSAGEGLKSVTCHSFNFVRPVFEDSMRIVHHLT